MWMNVTQLNIFAIVSFVMLVLILSLFISTVGNKFDEQKREIKELKQEVDELKKHIKE